jgi:SNF2 family DNA or RNA helicase
MLMDQRGPYTWVPKPNAVQAAYAMMQPSARYSLDDVMELPPVIIRFDNVALSPQQNQVYKRVATAMHHAVGTKEINAANAGVAMSKLLQICGGWVYTKAPEFVRLDASPRIATLADLCESAEHKVLVPIPYRHMIEGISALFEKLHKAGTISFDHCVVHGNTTGRDGIFNLFQNTDKYRVMLCHPATVSHGLTLTAADTIVWYLPVTSYDTYEQFNARIRRVSQVHKQQVIHLQSSFIERKLYKSLATKQKLQDQFLKLVEDASEQS